MSELPMVLYFGLQRIMRPLVVMARAIRAQFICWFWGVERKGAVVFAGPVFVRTRRRGSIRLDSVRFNASVRENPLCLGPNVIDTRGGGIITIGHRSGLSSAILSSRSSISIGKRVLVGAGTRIFDHDFHALKAAERSDLALRGNIPTKPVVVEDEVFIGTDCIILKGTHIGPRSLVAAGSVVCGLEIPPDSLVKGNPAVVVGSLKR